jgi:putative ABC transport system permease protein
VGVGVETPVGDSAFGTTMLVNRAGLERFAETEPFAQTLVRAAVGADPDALADDYERGYEITRQAPPREVSNLEELRGLPELLGGFFAMVGLAALADALLVAVRRRARDLAVLRVIGYTPNQIHTAVLVMGLVSAGVALIVGIPVGIIVARPLWQLVAEGASVEGDILVPGLRTVAIAVGVVFTALLVAMLAARRAARLQPGMLLRSE